MAANPLTPKRTYIKFTKVLAYLKAIQLLGIRFVTNSEMFTLLFNIVVDGGAFYD